MTDVASRELRNNTAELIRRAEAGEDIVITVNGRPAAVLVPISRAKRRWMTRDELVDLLEHGQADPGLRDDLRRLAGDTTDDLPPLS